MTVRLVTAVRRLVTLPGLFRVVAEARRPPPGDPAALESVAVRYRHAASVTGPIAQAAADLARAGEGSVEVSHALDTVPGALAEVADALTELAVSLRVQRRRHARFTTSPLVRRVAGTVRAHTAAQLAADRVATRLATAHARPCAYPHEVSGWLGRAAVASRDDLVRRIEGRDPEWLAEHLSLLGAPAPGVHRRGGVDVRQYESTTCGTTCLIVARAEHDPAYALSLTDGDFGANFAAERARVHAATTRLYPMAAGTSPPGMAAHLTRHLGVDYTWHLVDDTCPREVSRALRELVTAVSRGTPVPMLLGGFVPRHYVLARARLGGGLLVYEPGAGRTVLVPDRDVLEGRLAHLLGFDHLEALVLPRGV